MASAPILRRAKLSEQLANHLTALILDGSLPAAQALPTERELARQYGVSVGVVREAIRSLAAMGLLDVRHGVGSFVNPSDLWNTAAPMLLLIQSQPDSLLSVHDVRMPLELLSAEAATTMATPDDTTALRGTLDRMKVHLAQPESFVAADLAFHLALARATHNRILLPVLQPLIEPIQECMLRGHAIPRAASRAVEEHEAIVAAVEARAPSEAREAMRHHMETNRGELEILLRQESLPPTQDEMAEDTDVPLDSPILSEYKVPHLE